MTTAPAPAPVETKVKAATGGSLAGAITGLLISLLVSKVYHGEPLPAGVSDLLTAAVTAGLAAAGSFWAGYRAKHTARPPEKVHP